MVQKATPSATTTVPRAFAHSNDAVRRTTDPSHLPRLDHLRDRNIVTIDMDGTAYDPWACCGHRGNFRSDKTTGCTHIRQDTLDWVEEQCRKHDALPVVLSWRAGLVDITADWLTEINLHPAALFIPGSKDDVSGLMLPKMKRDAWGGGQVQFKVATVVTLQVLYGCTIVGATDDNQDVCTALADKLGLGWNVVRQCPRLVEIADHEWSAGYLGAPKTSLATSPYRPKDGDWYNAAPTYRTRSYDTPTLWDAYGNTSAAEDPTSDLDDIIDPFDTDENLARWGLTTGDIVKEPSYGIDGLVGEVVGMFDGLVMVEEAESGDLYEFDPVDLLVEDPSGWTPVALAADPEPNPDVLTNPGSSLSVGDLVAHELTDLGNVTALDGTQVSVDFGFGSRNVSARSLGRVRADAGKPTQAEVWAMADIAAASR